MYRAQKLGQPRVRYPTLLNSPSKRRKNLKTSPRQNSQSQPWEKYRKIKKAKQKRKEKKIKRRKEREMNNTRRMRLEDQPMAARATKRNKNMRKTLTITKREGRGLDSDRKA
ncbi:hypothetical protein COCNU_05G007040 [Cocos nucifera]|uniref:Uncharacterized protein n=1 Tax=Cocos nucifera TaxID=13894 RepID=A0A8K0N1N1_COCNU|nr:hypothetical protein COCNU_05G007040 [Cocos nucifera]